MFLDPGPRDACLVLVLTLGLALPAPRPARAAEPPEGPAAAAVRAKLATLQTVGSFERNTSLQEALDFLQKHCGVTIVYDRKALAASGIQDLEKELIQLPRMINIPAAQVLELLLSQVGGDEDTVRFRVRPGAVEITTARGEAVLRGTRLGADRGGELAARRAAGVREMLGSPVTINEIERNSALKDALGFLSERFGPAILIDAAAFRRLGRQDVEFAPVALAEQRSVPLAHILHQLMVQVEGPGGCGANFRLHDCCLMIAPTTELPTRLLFSSDGKRLATASPAGQKGQLIRVWDRGSGRAVGQFRLPVADLTGFTFTADGRALAVLTRGGAKGEQCRWALWNAASGKQEQAREWSAAGRLALAPDGRRVVSAAPARWGVRAVLAGKERWQPGVLPGPVASLTCSADGQTVLGIDRASEATTAALWRPGFAGGPIRFRLDRKRGGDGTPVSAVALSHDSRLLAAVDCLGRLDLWEVHSGRRIRRLESPALVRALAFSPDDNLLAASAELGMEHTVQVWELATGKPPCWLRGPPDGGLPSLAFSPDGKTLAGCTDDGTPLIWDVSDHGGGRRPGYVPPDQLQACWEQLLSRDAERAYQAVGVLAAHPAESVPFLRERLKPFAPPQGAASDVLAAALRDLDDDQFVRRNQAETTLLRLGKGVEPRLRRELQRPLKSLELRRRMERIVDRLQDPVASPELLRELRAVQALERAGTREAVQLLEQLMTGAPEGTLTQEARAARERLAQRTPIRP
jgi:hypothetical protein